MPLSRARDYLSIGEVLENVRSEFPDVSVSKIRFLEAEGLITPERTASGYRKFYEGDVKRLRYILGLQRDQFLPLKVIRERLDQLQSDGAPAAAGAPEDGHGSPRPGATIHQPTDVSLSRGELLAAAGLSEQQLRGLEDFGILATKDKDRYDGDDLTAAKAARGFFEFGVEPRHLRMYRQLADREASFVQQIVSPVLRKRDRDAPQEAALSARKLLRLSGDLREALIRSELRELL